MIDVGLLIVLLLALILLVSYVTFLMLFRKFYPKKYSKLILGEKKEGGEKY